MVTDNRKRIFAAMLITQMKLPITFQAINFVASCFEVEGNRLKVGNAKADLMDYVLKLYPSKSIGTQKEAALLGLHKNSFEENKVFCELAVLNTGESYLFLWPTASRRSNDLACGNHAVITWDRSSCKWRLAKFSPFVKLSMISKRSDSISGATNKQGAINALMVELSTSVQGAEYPKLISCVQEAVSFVGIAAIKTDLDLVRQLRRVIPDIKSLSEGQKDTIEATIDQLFAATLEQMWDAAGELHQLT